LWRHRKRLFGGHENPSLVEPADGPTPRIEVVGFVKTEKGSV
jgi:hypothetical protein